MIHFKAFRRRPCFNVMFFGVPLLIIGPLSLAMSGTRLAIEHHQSSSSSSQVGVSTDGAGTSSQTNTASSESHLGLMDVSGNNKSHIKS